MISAEDFVALLEQKDLLSEELLGDLRRKVGESSMPTNEPPWNKPISAARLAKWLVDNGHLSRLLAQRLLAKANQMSEAKSAPPQEPPKAEKRSEPKSEDLGFAPLLEEGPQVDEKPAPREQPGSPAKSPKRRRPAKPFK